MEEKVLDEKVLQEMRFRQDLGNKDASSPLYQIREKEMEISGRVFAARAQAEKMIADARQRAAEMVRTAEADADRIAKERADKILAEAEETVARTRAEGAEEVERLKKELAMRQSEAADFIVKLVTTV